MLIIFTLNNIINFWWPELAQINLMMLDWGDYNKLQDFISPVIDN
jgi:hypothetical protein